MTAKQAAFCAEYMKDLNGTQAAIRAGYSPKGAAVTASKMLTKANIKKELSRRAGDALTAFTGRPPRWFYEVCIAAWKDKNFSGTETAAFCERLSAYTTQINRPQD